MEGEIAGEYQESKQSILQHQRPRAWALFQGAPRTGPFKEGVSDSLGLLLQLPAVSRCLVYL